MIDVNEMDNSAKIVQLLIQKGANVNAKNNAGETPLHSAMERGRLEIVQMLVDAGARVNEPRNDGKKPVDLARENGHTKVVDFLLERGAVQAH